MQLLLIRHAEAAERDPVRWPDDADRPLTDEGRRQHRRVARRLRRRGLIPDLLVTSPWLRAWQTAEITTERTGARPPLPAAALAGAPDLEALRQALSPHQRPSLLALVGHEPWLGQLASLLLVGDPDRMAIDLPKSGVIGLDCEELAAGAAELQFFWRPKGG